MEEWPSTKGIVSLISISRPPSLSLWRSSRTAAHPDVISSLILLVSLASWIAAMFTLLLWRKVRGSVMLPLILFAFQCISRRQLVGVGAKSRVHFKFHLKRTWKKQVVEKSTMVGLSREDVFSQSKWSVGTNQVAAGLR